jgi:hypothetical protein
MVMAEVDMEEVMVGMEEEATKVGFIGEQIA